MKAAPAIFGQRKRPITKGGGSRISGGRWAGDRATAWLPDASAVGYVRGGDFETHGDNPNPASDVAGVEQAIWIVPLAGGPPRRLSERNSPEISPAGDRMVFLRAGQVWTVPLSGDENPSQLIHAKGRAGEMRFSPDGARLAFITNRTDHNLVSVYDFGSKRLKYIYSSVDGDMSPGWSADGKRIAQIRIAASSHPRYGAVRTAADPWSIRVADVESGAGREVWCAEHGAGDRLVFPWEKTGYRHLYAVSASGGAPAASTSGALEVEHVAPGAGRRETLFSFTRMISIAGTSGGCPSRVARSLLLPTAATWNGLR